MKGWATLRRPMSENDSNSARVESVDSQILYADVGHP
jgi:hypothetical protein